MQARKIPVEIGSYVERVIWVNDLHRGMVGFKPISRVNDDHQGADFCRGMEILRRTAARFDRSWRALTEGCLRFKTTTASGLAKPTTTNCSARGEIRQIMATCWQAGVGTLAIVDSRLC